MQGWGLGIYAKIAVTGHRQVLEEAINKSTSMILNQATKPGPGPNGTFAASGYFFVLV